MERYPEIPLITVAELTDAHYIKIFDPENNEVKKIKALDLDLLPRLEAPVWEEVVEDFGYIWMTYDKTQNPNAENYQFQYSLMPDFSVIEEGYYEITDGEFWSSNPAPNGMVYFRLRACAIGWMNSNWTVGSLLIQNSEL